MTEKDFKIVFEQLTGKPPLLWQERLYDRFVKEGDKLPSIIDLPTGLGKTMVMAIWLIARTQKDSKLPRRLIYVVDRRTVVDQATDLAIKFQKSVGKDKLAISTLRGQLADNREWSRDPSRPAIIIGTVDLIGSALLFSGYRSSFKQRPLEAGMLGQDSLLVLDEAHLSKPFEQLLIGKRIEAGKWENGIEQFQSGQGLPMKIIRMSATTASEDITRFKLEDTDFSDSIIKERFEATKRLTISTLGEKDKLTEKLAGAAIQLASQTDLKGKRIVVFVRKPDDARTIAEAIRDHTVETTDESSAKPKKVKSKPYENSVEVLTGTMRGLERDKLVEKPVFKDRWLNGDLKPDAPANQLPVFLISTSAGEVGFDLNADHMVCDAAPLDSMIQRLGRVNRRGKGDAQIHLFVEAPKKEKEDKPKKLEGLALAIANTVELLGGVNDVSPKNIAALKESKLWQEVLEGQRKSRYELACSPEPTMVELADILLDAWSMTSITEPMPGRPDVAPWLRGIADDLPQTTLAWRAELDLPGFDQLDLEDIDEWFDTHRVLTHENLSVPTSAAAKWFSDRWDKLSATQKDELGKRSIVVDRAGIKLVTVKTVVDQLARKNTDSIRNAELILPASFGGIERGKGLLDADAPEVPKDEDKKSIEEQRNAAKARSVAPDVADTRERFREQITKTEDGEPEKSPIGDGNKPPNASRFAIDLESDDEKRVQLVSHVPKREKPEWGSTKQMLSQHVGLVRKSVDDILSRIDVPEPVKLAAQLAAQFHDHGKNRERWQRTVNGTATVGSTDWIKQTKLEGDGKHQTLGKSGGEMKRDPRGYRHEFGSLREFIDAFNAGQLLDNKQKPVAQDVFDLALHLIAVHHGRGRPHFPKGGFDPDCESRSDEIHTEAIRRFARLQRQYGWWHLAWLENLLRCADALASADNDAEDATDSNGGGN